MARTARNTQVTARDLEVFSALDRCPLTVEQLLRLSQTFANPFTHPRLLRRRLLQLSAGGWVRRWPYAIASRGGAPDYYRLALDGYRMLHGPNATPPTRRHFAEIGIARHHHTRCLAEFLIQTVVSAAHHGRAVTEWWPENALALRIGHEKLYPDAAFRLQAAGRPPFNFKVELDNGTERIRSSKETDSIQRKMRLYDRYQELSGERQRVLFVTTRNADRLRHILRMARATVSNPDRSLFYGVCLNDYLACGVDALVSPCFLDHRRLRVAMIPAATAPSRSSPSSNADKAVAAVVL